MEFEIQSEGEHPETGEPNQEIEVKIVNLGDPAAFIERVLENGGVLTEPRRLLTDTGFKREGKNSAAGGEAAIQAGEIDPAAFTDPVRLRRVLGILGVTAKAENNHFKILVPASLPDRTVRIRRDGDGLTLTVKDTRNRNHKIAKRWEEEVGVKDMDEARRLLAELGYQPRIERQKYRTGYMLDSARVDLNEGPVAPPWAEIEASTPGEVLRILYLLGYAERDMANVSDAIYYRSHGISKERLRRLVFE